MQELKLEPEVGIDTLRVANVTAENYYKTSTVLHLRMEKNYYKFCINLYSAPALLTAFFFCLAMHHHKNEEDFAMDNPLREKEYLQWQRGWLLFCSSFTATLCT